MESIRKWFYRPKRDDTSLLAQFFYADESLNAVACELDSFDGRQEPERCTTLVNQLRHCQDKVLTICNQIMDELIPESRANRDFRVKFPDDVMQENLAGQLWFGAECLAAGSSIMNREAESSAMRPLAKALTKSLELVRNLLREHALKGHMNLKAQNQLEPSIEKLIESLKIFDRLFADFELCYVGAMVPVKSTKEYEQQELVCVLFSETLQRALERGLLSQSDVDNYEPALMFTIPRLAIVAGLLAPPGGPLCLNSPDTISEMFRPFRNLLLKIRELLWTLNNRELYMLEKLLCSNEEPSASTLGSQTGKGIPGCHEIPDVDEFVHNFYTDYPNCKDFIVDFYTITRNTGGNMDETANDAVRILDDENGRIEYFIERRLNPDRREKRLRRGVGSKCPRVSSEKSSRGTSSRMMGNSSTSVVADEDSRFVDSRDNDDTRNPSMADSSDSWMNSKDYRLESLTLEDNNDDPLDNNENSISRDTTRIRTNPRESNDPTSIEVSNPEDFTNPDITRILGAQTDSIEIPQTQYLLNQVSHENQVTGETRNIENSLPDIDSQKLISEANKTLSSLLLETSNANNPDCQNEISEQTDSGICTVISSENTSLYDKSPEEKKTFANDLGDTENNDTRDEDENTSYSCSSSTRRDNAITPTSESCVCNNTRSNWNKTDNRDASYNRVSRCVDQKIVKENVGRISSSFNGTSEEFIGVAYGNGQISVCDSNPSTLQINYSENWETLMNRNIERSSPGTTEETSGKPDFRWSSFECKNCPSTSRPEIRKIGDDIERYARVRIAARRGKEAKVRKRTQRKYDRRNPAKRNNEETPPTGSGSISAIGESNRSNDQHRTRLTTASTESSRSNSTDRCLSPRLVNFGASLHPSRNTRQMPNFGGHSPQPSPRLCHFEARAATSNSNSFSSRTNGSRVQSAEKYAHNRKLLDHRRSRSEQIAKIKRATNIATAAAAAAAAAAAVDNKRAASTVETESDESKFSFNPDNRRTNDDLMNDGLGPRTDKSGLPPESPSPPPIPKEKLCALRSPDDTRDNDIERDKERTNTGLAKTPNLTRNAKTPTPKIQVSVASRRTTNKTTSSSFSSFNDSSSSSETSEFQSDCQDDEEIALAMQAAEIANRNQIRAKFRSSEDLVHRLFVCIAGVADQLQTNFASDLRNILKCVFLMNSSQIVETSETTKDEDQVGTITTPSNESLDIQTSPTTPDTTDTTETIIERQDSLREDDEEYEETTPTNERSSPMTECGEECIERAPAWVPDNDAPRCMACQAGFTVVRRRHHCRNCGKVFCGRCSSNNVPLPRYGHTKPVRVCNRCFIYQVMPFTVSQVATTS